MGYRRPDGSVGTRNYLIILPSVFCANTTAEKIAAQIPGRSPCRIAWGARRSASIWN